MLPVDREGREDRAGMAIRFQDTGFMILPTEMNRGMTRFWMGRLGEKEWSWVVLCMTDVRCIIWHEALFEYGGRVGLRMVGVSPWNGDQRWEWDSGREYGRV